MRITVTVELDDEDLSDIKDLGFTSAEEYVRNVLDDENLHDVRVVKVEDEEDILTSMIKSGRNKYYENEDEE